MATKLGTPQGGNLSPILSNIMLNELDNQLKFAFRSKNASLEVLTSVAAVNKIALNLRMLNELLEDVDEK